MEPIIKLDACEYHRCSELGVAITESDPAS